MLLEDKIVLITGAGSGIGRATAIAMAQAGAHVVCADINETAANESAKLVAESSPSLLQRSSSDFPEKQALLRGCFRPKAASQM